MVENDPEQDKSVTSGSKGRISFGARLRRPGKLWSAAVFILAFTLATGSVLVAVSPFSLNVAAYILYGTAAIATGYALYLIISTFIRLKAAVKVKLDGHPGARRLIDNYGLRTVLMSFMSFVLAALFAIGNGVAAVLLLSVWYGVIAGYYFVLSVVRIIIVTAGSIAGRLKNQYVAKLRVSIGGGFALLWLEWALLCVIVLRLVTSPPEGNKIIAIASAAYTFVKVIMAIINAVRAKRYKDPVVETLRYINLTDALVSLVTLETTMVALFGNASDMIPISASLGFIVCAVTIFIAIYLIISSWRKLILLKKQQKGEVNERE